MVNGLGGSENDGSGNSADANAADMGEGDGSEAAHGAGNFDGVVGDSATDDESSADDNLGAVDYSGWDGEHANEFAGLTSHSTVSPTSTSNITDGYTRTSKDLDFPSSVSKTSPVAPPQVGRVDPRTVGYVAKDEEVSRAWTALKDKHSQTDTKSFFGLFDYKDPVHSRHQKEKDVQAFVDKYGRHLDDMGKRNTQAVRAQEEADKKSKGPPKTGIDAVIDSVTKGFNPASMIMGLIGGPLAGIATSLLSNIPQHQPTQIEQELEEMQKELGMIDPEVGEQEIPIHRARTLCNAKPGMRWDDSTGSCVASTVDEDNPITTNAPSGQSLSESSIVWKPVSEGDGRLVILTPPGTDSADVSIEDMNGQVIDTGRNTGRTNGNRFTYRFSMPGSGYETAAFLNVGGIRYRIDNPAARIN